MNAKFTFTDGCEVWGIEGAIDIKNIKTNIINNSITQTAEYLEFKFNEPLQCKDWFFDKSVESIEIKDSNNNALYTFLYPTFRMYSKRDGLIHIVFGD